MYDKWQQFLNKYPKTNARIPNTSGFQSLECIPVSGLDRVLSEDTNLSNKPSYTIKLKSLGFNIVTTKKN